MVGSEAPKRLANLVREFSGQLIDTAFALLVWGPGTTRGFIHCRYTGVTFDAFFISKHIKDITRYNSFFVLPHSLSLSSLPFYGGSRCFIRNGTQELHHWVKKEGRRRESWKGRTVSVRISTEMYT